MARVTGFTADRMLQIERDCIVSGAVLLDDLILTKRDGTTINAGNVRGPKGDKGDPGINGTNGTNGIDAPQGSVEPTANSTVTRTSGGQVRTTDPVVGNDSASKTYADNGGWMSSKYARLQFVLSGGGVRKTSSIGISWSERFIAIGSGREPGAPNGFYDIAMPGNGVVIPHYFSATASTTVANGIVPLAAWHALYYEPPADGATASNPANFRIMDYRQNSSFRVPASWIFIAVRNGDPNAVTYKWGDGRAQDYWRSLPLLNGWVVFDEPGWGAAQWRFTSEGEIRLRGVIKHATTTTLSQFAGFDASLGPDRPEIFFQPSGGTNGNGMTRVDSNPNGGLYVTAYAVNAAVASHLSLRGIEWTPKGT